MWRPAPAARAAPALLLVVLLAALAHAHKRAEISPMPFVLGSRYGRSEPRMLAPRNDRFFMGSRYGKRSESPLPLQLPLATPSLLCEFTGVATLYHCEMTGVSQHVAGHDRKIDDPTTEGADED